MTSKGRVYTVKIHDERDDGYWAEVVELPGLFASGHTWQEFQEALTEALSQYLSTPERPVRIKLEDEREVESVKVTEQRVLVSS